MKKYPETSSEKDTRFIDGMMKVMYVPAPDHSVNIFSLNHETLELEHTLAYPLAPQRFPIRADFVREDRSFNEQQQAHCIHIAPNELEDLLRVARGRGDMFARAVNQKLKECYGLGTIPEEFIAVYDENKDFQGVTGPLSRGR